MFILCKAGGLPDENGVTSGRARNAKRRQRETVMPGDHLFGHN